MSGNEQKQTPVDYVKIGTLCQQSMQEIRNNIILAQHDINDNPRGVAKLAQLSISVIDIEMKLIDAIKGLSNG